MRQVGDLLRPAGTTERRGAAGDDLGGRDEPVSIQPGATELTVTP